MQSYATLLLDARQGGSDHLACEICLCIEHFDMQLKPFESLWLTSGLQNFDVELEHGSTPH